MCEAPSCAAGQLDFLHEVRPACQPAWGSHSTEHDFSGGTVAPAMYTTKGPPESGCPAHTAGSIGRAQSGNT